MKNKLFLLIGIGTLASAHSFAQLQPKKICLNDRVIKDEYKGSVVDLKDSNTSPSIIEIKWDCGPTGVYKLSELSLLPKKLEDLGFSHGDRVSNLGPFSANGTVKGFDTSTLSPNVIVKWDVGTEGFYCPNEIQLTPESIGGFHIGDRVSNNGYEGTVTDFNILYSSQRLQVKWDVGTEGLYKPNKLTHLH